MLLSATGGELAVAAAWPPDTELDVTDMTAARWAMEKNEPAGNGTGTLPNSPFQFRPLGASAGRRGVVGYRQAGKMLDAAEEQVLGSILDQTAIAIDRARLSKESLEQAARLEGERFRSALLSSISHDLKTPLATITGAVSSLRELGDKMTPESRDDLLASIEEESDRLARFVANLLDMTRIEAGTVDAEARLGRCRRRHPRRLQRAAQIFPGPRPSRRASATDLPLIRGDSVLLGQVLFNLIDNAVKYGGERADQRLCPDARRTTSSSPSPISARAFRRRIWRTSSKSSTGAASPTAELPEPGFGLAIARGFRRGDGRHDQGRKPGRAASAARASPCGFRQRRRTTVRRRSR